VAGCESLSWHPLVADFFLVGRKLEKLDFTYYKGRVMVVEHLEENVDTWAINQTRAA